MSSYQYIEALSKSNTQTILVQYHRNGKLCIVLRHQNCIKSIIFFQFNAVSLIHQNHYQKSIHKLCGSRTVKTVRFYVTLQNSNCAGETLFYQSLTKFLNQL